LGKNTENTSTSKPSNSTAMVAFELPFHSLSRIPQTLLKVTFKAIRIDQEKASMMALSARKLLPMDKPKNCEYHNKPANAQNSRLFTHTEPSVLV